MLAAVIASTAPHSTAAVGSSAYNVAYIVLAVLTMVGMGIAAAKWLKKQGATEAAVKKLLELQASLQKIVDANVLQRLSSQDDALADIRQAIRPNGLDSQELGDIAKRTELAVERLEKKVDATSEKLAVHMGASDVVERDVWRAIKDLQSGKG